MMPDPSAHNSLLAQFATGLWRALSPLARRLAFPRGIVFLAEQAHAAALNATIGQVTDGRGAPMPLPSLEAQLGPIDRKVSLLYAPMAGNAEIRKLWGAWQAHAAGHPEVASTLPYMTHGLTHGLSMLADLLIDADTTLVVISDHGFRVSSAQPLINGSHNDVAVFLAAGPKVKPGKIKLHVFDVAPTLYALLGLPAAEDMPGKVLTEAFDVTPVAKVPTWTLERVSVQEGAADGGLADDQLRDQLEALGYIDEHGLPDASIGGSRRQQ